MYFFHFLSFLWDSSEIYKVIYQIHSDHFYNVNKCQQIFCDNGIGDKKYQKKMKNIKNVYIANDSIGNEEKGV